MSDTDNVGEGWRELRVGEVVQIGDEFFNETGWHVTTIGGVQLGPKNFPYRRRVTPGEKPLGAFLDEENNTLRAENAALRSEVERLRLRPDELDAIEHGQALLLVVWQQNQQASGIFAEGKKASDVLLKLLKRLGGGE